MQSTVPRVGLESATRVPAVAEPGELPAYGRVRHHAKRYAGRQLSSDCAPSVIDYRRLNRSMGATVLVACPRTHNDMRHAP
jgi:hypothetical protein